MVISMSLSSENWDMKVIAAFALVVNYFGHSQKEHSFYP